MLDAYVAEQLGLSLPLTREDVEACCLRSLNRLLAYAGERSPFYRARLGGISLDRLSDMSAVPVTTAEDLRRSWRAMLCVGGDDIQRIVTAFTSGSTGASKRVCSTALDQERTVEFFNRGMATLISPEDRVLLLFPGESPGSLNELLKRGIERMGAEAEIFGFPTRERLDELCARILRGGFTSLIGPPSAVAAAAVRSMETGCAGTLRRQLSGVLLAAEYVSAEHRESISRAWDCGINEHYGLTETGFIGPVSCSAHQGYHLPTCDIFIEIVDPLTRLPLPCGQTGEVLVTTLRREAMPLIRYATGDMSRFIPEKCPCGSALPRLDRVLSRPEAKKFSRPEPVFLEDF